MGNQDSNLWKYRLEAVEKEVCEHKEMIKEINDKVNEHDKLIDRVSLKLDQISANVIEVKTGLKTLTDKQTKDLEEEVKRPINLKWAVIAALVITVLSSMVTRLLVL